jgi:hypothetical protein
VAAAVEAAMVAVVGVVVPGVYSLVLNLIFN